MSMANANGIQKLIILSIYAYINRFTLQFILLCHSTMRVQVRFFLIIYTFFLFVVLCLLLFFWSRFLFYYHHNSNIAVKDTKPMHIYTQFRRRLGFLLTSVNLATCFPSDLDWLYSDIFESFCKILSLFQIEYSSKSDPSK